MGDIFLTIIMWCMIAIPFLILFRLFQAYKRSENRAAERLELEKETTVRLQKRVDELDERVVVIEKMLREVE